MHDADREALEIAGHVPKWAAALFPDGSVLTRSEFYEQLVALPFDMPMGPKGNISPDM